jgi:chemotaxis protein MotB
MANEDRQEGRSGGGGEAEEEERTDGWMATYADMVTLLMTFFVLMFAISNVDQQKGMLFFGGLSRGGLSAEEFQDIVRQFSDELGDDPDVINFPRPGEGGGGAGNSELDQLSGLIDGFIEAEGLGGVISTSFNGEFLLLTLRSDIWFESASAVVRPEMRDIGLVLADMLAQLHNPDSPFEVVVAGHTDNLPINTVRYPSNWHVSVDRALNFLDILITESGLDPGFFYARGCGEHRPIADNDTPEGRQMNRRVEVMISLLREDARRDGIMT